MNKELTQEPDELYQKLAKFYEQVLRSKDLRSKASHNELKFYYDPEALTQRDIRSFFSELMNYLAQLPGVDGRGPADLPRLILKKCEALIKTDNDAELVRSGFILCRALDTRLIEKFYAFEQLKHRAKGRKTKAANLDKRDAEIVAEYREHMSEVSCLNARRRLKEKYDFSLTHVNNILKKAGIVINRKSQSRF